MTVDGSEAARELGLDAGSIAYGGNRFELASGTIIAPRDSMAERVERTADDDEAIEALRALGYVE